MRKFTLLLVLCTMTVTLFAAKPLKMRVASYNLRLMAVDDGENNWDKRKDKVSALIQFHDFDIFGTQEGFKAQLDYLWEMGDYAYIGVGRDDGVQAGEHSAIFYKTSKFLLLDRGDFWLSETPGEPSLGWDAKYRRVCSWGKFKDRQSNRIFYVFNVHFDHVAKTARIESGRLMVSKIREIAGTTPVICVGDFNSTPETEQIATMKTILKDSHDCCRLPAYGPEGTFNSFVFNTATKNRIDYIFVSEKIDVIRYGVLTDSQDNRFPSDHFPIIADIEMK